MSLKIAYCSSLRNDTIERNLLHLFKSMKAGYLNWENVPFAILFCWKDDYINLVMSIIFYNAKNLELNVKLFLLQ